MFQHFTDHNFFIYHYTSTDTAINYILDNMSLKLGSLLNTNDPKEYKEWQFDFGLPPNFDKSPNYQESVDLWRKISYEIKKYSKVACFSCDKPGIGKNPLADTYMRGFAKARMWAQYGDNHKGVCLIFNKNQLCDDIHNKFSGIADIFHSKIEYKNRMLKGDIVTSPYTIDYPLLLRLGIKEYTKAHLNKFADSLLFEKVTDWQDEDEFRIIVRINNEEDQYIDIDRSLCGVMFGADTPEKDIRCIFQKAVGNGRGFEQIEYKNSTPWFSFKDFRQYHSKQKA